MDAIGIGLWLAFVAGVPASSGDDSTCVLLLDPRPVAHNRDRNYSQGTGSGRKDWLLS